MRFSQPLFTLLALLLLVPAALAQAPAQQAAVPSDWPSAALLAEQSARLGGLGQQVDALEAQIGAEARSDESLVDVRLHLDEVAAQVIDSGVAFRTRLDQINARLAQIGPPPAEGQPPEPQPVTDERQARTDEKATINSVLGTAEQLSLRVDVLNSRVANLRRDLFASQLTQRTPINLALLADVETNFAREVASLGRTVAAWWSFVYRFKLQSVLGACFFALLAAGILLLGGRRVARRLVERDPANPAPSALDKLSAAFWSTVLPSLAVVVALGSTLLMFDYFEVLRGDIGAILASLFRVIGVVYFVHRLSLVTLAPLLPNWRLVPVRSRAAKLLVALISTMAAFNGVDYFLASVSRLRGAALSLTVAESFVATLGIGLLLFLVALVRPFAHHDGSPKRWPVSVRALLFAMAALTVLPALAGYIGFARFASRQIVVTGAILALMYIGFLLARAVAEEGAFVSNRFGRSLKRRWQLEDHSIDQIALLVSFTINVAVVLVGVPLILLQWGFQPGDLEAYAYRIAAGFQIGTFRFSPAAVFGGLLVFVVGWFLTRWFQRWLDGTVLERGRVDSGVRNSVRLVIGYAGLGLAGLIAISTAGIDLSSLALVAGALSLGIGFGLQNIVSNFVSGLILLAERPFKVGDWIVAGTTTGTVKKISVRATEIETFQRQTVILPNSDLINGAVGNWTHRNRLGRVDLKFFLAFDNDMRRVHDLMMEIARANPQVLRNPEPQVVFVNMSAAAFEMEVRVFMADILAQNAVLNDLRFEILDAFRRKGIEIVSAPRPAIEPPKLEATAEPAPAPEPATIRENRRARLTPGSRG
jgi:potassium-dependent mechanosensitive channel